MANRRGTRVSRGTRRKKVWARSLNTGASVAAGAGEAFRGDLLSPFRAQMGIDSALPGLTVIRIRGSIQLVETSAAQVGVVGIRVYSRSGDDAGAALAAVDGPSSDPHADWMMFQTQYNEAGGLRGREFDIRAMRKLEELNDSLVIAFDTPDELGGQFQYTASVLLALP